MITILPGDFVHTEFGHSALRVRDPARGIDSLYNYGTFSFSDPYFIPKFAYGELRYFLSVAPTNGALYVYRRQQRPVIEQVLALSAAQRNALYRFLRENAKRANRYYRYDFLYDNCSTRVRDALTTALGDAVQYADRPDPQRSFRRMLDPYVADRPALDLGFDLGLGLPADEVVTPHESMFLPEYLLEGFAHATVTDASGTRSLVARTDTLLWVDGYDPTEAAFPWPVAAGWLAFGIVLGWTGWQWRTGRSLGRWADAVYLALLGLAGVVISFLWFVSLHDVTGPNLNLLWALPTHAVAAVAVAKRRATPRLRIYLIGSAGVAALLAAGWWAWPQAMHAAVLPLLLATALRLGARAWRMGQDEMGRGS